MAEGPSLAPALRVLLVDGQPVVRLGVRTVLAAEVGPAVFLEAGSMPEAIELLEAKPVHLVITAVELETGGGFELTKQIRSRWPYVRVMLFSSQNETLFARRGLAAGALGYVMKREPVDVLVAAARAVLNGQVYVSDVVRREFVQGLAGIRDAVSPLEQLSDRELEVFEHLGQGLDRSEIARVLHLSVKTVESYRARIKTKLGLSTAARLRRVAVQWVDEAKRQGSRAVSIDASVDGAASELDVQEAAS